MKLKFSIALFLMLSLRAISQEAYYHDVNINLTGLSLKNELATKIIASHTQFLWYEQIWNASKITDRNPNNNTEVLLIYGWENGSDSDITNDRQRSIDQNSGAVGDWNREHVYSRSLGTPNLGESGPGSDAHHLRPSDPQRNSSRNNRKFTDGNGTSGTQTNGGWYPGDEWKGDVARMMMYMYLRYDTRCLPSNVGFGSSANTPDDMIDLFLQWNAEDPVSDFEKQRNNYHENTANQDAQGNRNPFIDNPRLATRIWGGPEAEDLWGIYSNTDSEAPTAPTNLAASNLTTFSVDLSWTAATDNIGVSSYDIFVNGNLEIATSETSISLNNLSPDTNYSFAVLAKDLANNSSQLSLPLDIKTLQDTTAPTIPENIVVSNETGSTFIISWNASTDNTKVVLYEVYLDDVFLESVENENYTATGLSTSTTYKAQVLAVDESGNKSALSNPVNASTTDGSTTTANELFFSEYVEGSSNNKALEIANVTATDIDLSNYSIKRQSNGGVDGDDWENELILSGMIFKNDVFVIINGSAALQTLINEADFTQPNNSDTNYGAPINFNGNDPVGLFKNDVLIDIIGTFDAGSANFAKDKTLRRKSGVAQPNTNFDLSNEWDVFSQNTVDDIGNHNATLGALNFDSFGIKLYPNPAKNTLKFLINNKTAVKHIRIFNMLGKEIIYYKYYKKEIPIKSLSKGLYIINFVIENQLFSKKFIKQ